jgi:hypothetical protein
MAAVVFTTWTDLHVALLNAYADFIANRIQLTEFTLNTGSTTRTFKYQDPDKLLNAIKEVKTLADMESGAAVGRTYAANGGGRWQ